MKKTIIGMLVLSFLVGFSALALAAKKQEVVVKAPAGLSEEARKNIYNNTVTAINAQVWQIFMTGLGAPGTKVETDTFTFVENKLTSAELNAEGFASSNCNIHVREDGVGVFETVQRKEDGSYALIRGEFINNNLYGSMSIHYKNGQVRSHSFSSVAPAAPVATIKETGKKK